MENKWTEMQAQMLAFQMLLNAEPKANELGSTPDGKAKTLPISFIETTLDELYFGQWSTENFTYQLVANEVIGSLELIVVHPITGHTIRRTGAASIQITVDAVPDDIKNDRQQKNRWALDPSNKKSNALDMSFPKLKAECTKNAAQSLGRIFGRDLNRKQADKFNATQLGNVKSAQMVVEMFLKAGKYEQATKALELLPESMQNQYKEKLLIGDPNAAN